ncbi:Hypothetical protein NGAL_HAMBI490_56400 [Neorhizobium galegae bv. officinalis]|nr:Hypothetical protein NGAL_HAMBI490_56400 [Neorhizobium galegae bv. officinalis]
MFQVLTQCRSIVFDDGVSYAPSAERFVIGISDLLLQEITPLCHPCQNALETAGRIQIKQMFSKVIRLREQKPVKVLQSELGIDGRHGIKSGNHCQRRKCPNSVRMIERQAIANARAAVVTDHTERLMAERCHERRYRPRHAAFGEAFRASENYAPAISRQVWNDEAVVARKSRRHAAPGNMCFGKPVQKKDRWPGATDHSTELNRVRLHLERPPTWIEDAISNDVTIAHLITFSPKGEFVDIEAIGAKRDAVKMEPTFSYRLLMLLAAFGRNREFGQILVEPCRFLEERRMAGVVVDLRLDLPVQ